LSLALILIIALFLCSCTPAAAPAAGPAPAASQPAAPAPSGPVQLKVAQYFAAPAAQSVIIDEFCKELQARTGGKIKVDFFPGGTLLSSAAMYDGIVNGIADIGYSHVLYTPGKMPVTEGATLPLGYPSAWVGGHALMDFYNQVKPKEFDAVQMLWMNTSTPSCISTSKKAIRTLADLKGLNIRAPGIAGDVVKALGGTPAPTPMPEVQDAIAKGVLDGEQSNYETLLSFKFADVVKYETSMWQITFPYPFYFAMNKNVYNKLPADVKPIFDELVGEYAERSQIMWNSIDFAGRDYGISKGVEFITLSDAEAAKFVAAVQPVVGNWVKGMTAKGFSESEVNGWIKFIQDRIGYWTKKQIDYRITSANGPPEVRAK